MKMHNRQRRSHLGLLLLASQVFQLGVDNIPPVTLVTLGLNVYLFIFPAKPLLQTCVSVQQAYWHGDWHRLLLSPFHHVDDWHLYFNMVSLIWKGIKLEHRMGGPWFTYLLAVFSLLTGLVYLLLEVGLSQLMNDPSYSMQCAVGFSGVLFGLKVVNNHFNPGGVNYIMGLPVANCYACWVELILIHIMNPGTSFVGHLAGILVGLLYVTGPLNRLMKTCAGLVTSNSGRPDTYYNSSGYSGYGMPYPPYSSSYPGQGPYGYPNSNPYSRMQYTPNGPSAPSQHPFTAGMSEEEQYDAAIKASLHYQRGSSSAPTRPSYGFNVNSDPTIEKMRRCRLQRFDN